jgi:ABC-type spermidine/putrescine transport system permease subunit II
MMAGRFGLALGAFGVIVYLLFPVIVVVTISLSSGTYLNFPPPGLSLQWYRKMVHDPEWLSAFWVTIKVGVLASLVATAVGVPAAFALVRTVIPGKAFLNALILSALITPPIVSAIGIFLMYVPLGLVNSAVGLACAHAVAGIPFVVINTAASLRSADRDLERAAIIHGASPLMAAVRITLPIVSPGVLVGFILSFVHSAHELLIAIFILGGVGKPISVKMWSQVQATTDPSVTAVSTVLIGVAILTVMSVGASRSVANRRAGVT